MAQIIYTGKDETHTVHVRFILRLQVHVSYTPIHLKYMYYIQLHVSYTPIHVHVLSTKS